MKITIRRIFSDKLGTHYGLYLNTSLIHYEFSRIAAEKIAKNITSGATVYEALYKQVKQECISLRKTTQEIEQLQACIKMQSKQIKRLKKVITELNFSNKSKKVSSVCEPTNLEASQSKKLKIFKADILAKKYHLEEEKANELEKLLLNMSRLNFSLSSELSNYIKTHNLGHEYPNIAGIVKMQRGNETWDFKGGFPTDIYKIICSELDLKSKDTSAWPIKFTPYKMILGR